MERRAFLKLLCIGAGVVAAAAPAEALTSFAPLAAPARDLEFSTAAGRRHLERHGERASRESMVWSLASR